MATPTRFDREGRVRELPGGWLTRAGAVVAFAAMVVTDAPSDYLDLTNSRGWLALVVPFLPILAIAAGAVPAIVTWFLAFVLVLALGGEPSTTAALLFSTPLTLGLGIYLLPRRPAVAASAVAIGVPALLPVVNPNSLGAAVFIAVAILLSCLAGLGLNTLRHRSETGEDEIHALREQQEKMRREERALLAYELHDIVAHDVTVMALQARRAKIVKDPAVADEALDAISHSAQKTLEDLHSLVSLLKDDGVDRPIGDAASDPEDLDVRDLSGEKAAAEGLVEDLRCVADAIERAGFSVRLEVEGTAVRVPASMRQAVRRTVRELGTNILKHGAPTGEVDLRLTVDQNVSISASNAVADDAPIASSSSGIDGIRARCEVVEGTMTAGIDSGGRWTTTITIPLNPRSELDPERMLDL